MKWEHFMNLRIKQSTAFVGLFEFDNLLLRKLLDLQYRTICQAEKILLKNIDLKKISVLDHGAGRQEFKKRHQCASYNSIDPYFPADWKSEVEIPTDKNFDLIVSNEVFEHLEDPMTVLKNLSKLQKKGQKIYITTPFLARQHGAPQDFQRWTEIGLERLLRDAGYKTEVILRRGNFLAVISTFLNYKLFTSLRSRFFLIALVGAPVVLLTLAMAQLFLFSTRPKDFYLGLSVLASKAEDL